VIIGEDVSAMMDMNERPAGHESMNDRTIVKSILDSSDYSQYGIIPDISDPPTSETPERNERTPTQRNTDLGYLRELAGRYGYVFYIVPGPASGQNTAYWGPPRQEGQPQQPLSVNMGPFTNVEQINFNYNALSPTRVTGSVQDRESNEPTTLRTSSEEPALSSRGSRDQAQIRGVLAQPSGLTTAQTQGRIRGMMNSSVGKAATANGELDAMCYGGLLWPHRLVEVRGAGRSYDGLWYVNQVSHVLRKSESYKQRFSLSREGLGTTVQQVGERG
jgi:phage protein D